MKFIIITNNPLVFKKYNTLYKIKYYENANFLKTLEKVRSEVHLGHEILTHPLTGSIKPGETPFKSIIISTKISSLNFDSLKLIEDAITTTKKFVSGRKWTDKIIKDFKLIDYDIITSGIESINQHN